MMAAKSAASAPLAATEPAGIRRVRTAAEAVALVLVVAAPWFLGGTTALAGLLLAAGLALLLLLWAVRCALEGGLRWSRCGAAVCLALLLLESLGQLTPLSRPTLAWLSPE